MTRTEKTKSLGTHDGRFHADEVTACALLLYSGLIDKDKIIRTRDYSLLNDCEYVCDVGGIYDPSQKRFDHHQSDYEGNFSSAGMILHDLVERKKIDPDFAVFLKEDLVDGVDMIDNGKGWTQGISTFSHVISQFNPVPYEVSKAEEDKTFLEAVDFALWFIDRIHQRYRYQKENSDAVAKAMELSDYCLKFEKPVAWQEAFFALGGEDHPAQFVMMPIRGQWKLRGIPPNQHHRMQVRTPFPESWAGLLDQELERVTEIRGALFCHKGRFVSVWATEEAAEKALGLIRKKRSVAQ